MAEAENENVAETETQTEMRTESVAGSGSQAESQGVVKPETAADVTASPSAGRFTRLPRHIPLKDTIASQDPDAPPDPTMGRDPERDFMLRNAGG